MCPNYLARGCKELQVKQANKNNARTWKSCSAALHFKSVYYVMCCQNNDKLIIKLQKTFIKQTDNCKVIVSNLYDKKTIYLYL